MKCIYLIKPRWLATDIVYKVLLLGDDIYFCRIGGQFYKIQQKESEYNENMSLDIFMNDKKNFRKNKLTLNNVKVNSRKSIWTGHINNNGTVAITERNKTEKYIIHPVQSAKKVANFFKMIMGLSVDFIEKKRDLKPMIPGAFNPKIHRKSSEYKKVAEITRNLNNFGWLLGLWLLIFPKPYLLVVILSIALPIVGMYIYLRFNEYVEFDEKRGSKNPNVGSSVALISIGLGLRALLDFNVFYNSQLWLYIVVITLIILVIVLVKTKEYKTKKWLPILITFSILSYVFGTIILSNCLLDRSVPKVYTSYVIDKYINKGKSTTYYLTIDPWGPVLSTEDVDVSRQLYNSVKKDQKVYLHLKKGALGIKWFELTESER